MHEGVCFVRPDSRCHVDRLGPIPISLTDDGPSTARTVRYRSGSRDHRALPRVLDVVNRFLMVVPARIRSTPISAKSPRIFCVSLRPCRCDSSPRTGLWCITMTRASPRWCLARRAPSARSNCFCRMSPMIEMSRTFHVSVRCVTPVSGIDSDERRAGHVEHRLEVLVDEPPIVLVDARLVAEAERRLPPLDVVVAGNDDDLADLSRVANERGGALELAGPRALREVARDRDDVELLSSGLSARSRRSAREPPANRSADPKRGRR